MILGSVIISRQNYNKTFAYHKYLTLYSPNLWYKVEKQVWMASYHKIFYYICKKEQQQH